MKKAFYLLLTGCLFSLYSFSATPVPATPSADEYSVNDQQIEQLFANSEDVSVTATSASLLNNSSVKNSASNKAFYAGSDKSFVTALLLNFFLGGLGIHRLYLGTKTFTWVGYILTCGGIFGIVPLIDFIVLIIHNDDLSPYVNNPQFFMWSGGNM